MTEEKINRLPFYFIGMALVAFPASLYFLVMENSNLGYAIFFGLGSLALAGAIKTTGDGD